MVSSEFNSYKTHEYYTAGQDMMKATGCAKPLEVDLEKLLSVAVNDVATKVTGLCLSCVKHGTLTEEGDNCYAKLEYFCSTRQVDEHLQGDQSASEDIEGIEENEDSEDAR